MNQLLIPNEEPAQRNVPIDIVIDTNVLEHASNTQEERQEDSIKLIQYLLSSTELLCIDEGFDLNESRNRSYIGYEYLDRLKNGTLGYVFLTIMAQTKRIDEVSRTVNVNLTRKINQCMRNNHDRVFIKVAINSNDKTLVSHDFADFPVEKREHIEDVCDINVLIAREAYAE